MKYFKSLSSIPLLLLGIACGSDGVSDATGADGGSAQEGGAGTAGTGGGDVGTDGSAGQPSCTGTQTTDDRLSRALDVLRSELDTANVPGGAIAIVKDGMLVDVGVTGSKRASTCDPITADTMFQGGALAHLLTSMAVLDSQEDGKLSVSDPITRWVPTVQVTNADYGTADGITLHHLLANSSMYAPGSSATGFDLASDCLPSLADEFADLRSSVLYALPGSMHHGLWSDIGLAGLALQNAEGKPFADVVRTRVLEPLGMGGTFETAPFLAGDHAEGSDQPLRDCPNYQPSMQYYVSIRDAARLAEYLTGGAGQILDAPAFDALFSEQGPWLFSFQYKTYGAVGFRADSIGDVVLNLSSWNFGYAVDLTVWRTRRLAVITLVNAAGFSALNAVWNTSSRVAKIYDPSIGDGSWTDYNSPPTPESLPSLVGTYQDALGFRGSGPRTLEVFVDTADATKLAGNLVDSLGTSLAVTFDGTRSLELPAPSADNFIMRGPSTVPVRFWRDGTGSVSAVSLFGSYGPPFFRVTTP